MPEEVRADFDGGQGRRDHAEAGNVKIADDLARQRGDQVGGGDDVGDRRRTRQDDRNPPSQAPRGENRIDQARAAPVRRDPDMAGVDHVIEAVTEVCE